MSATQERREARTVFLDYDARRTPKTKRFCVKCQRDLKPWAKARIVRVNGAVVIHPLDVEPGIGEDFLVGMDCAKQIGMPFTREEL